VAQQPVILFVMSGGALDLSAYKNDPRVGAIVWAGYIGQSGGEAIADVLFGEESPAGRLPYTIYPASYVNEILMSNMHMRPNETENSPGRTYRFYTGFPVYEFGFGLSYTEFNYTVIQIEQSPRRFTADKINALLGLGSYYSPYNQPTLAELVVEVENIGDVSSDDVVLAFMIPPGAGMNGIPKKFLFGFDRVHLRPHDKITVTFPIMPHQLSLVGEDGFRSPATGVWKVQVGNKDMLSLIVE